MTLPRQQAILELLSQRESLSARELMKHFDISIATAYRDLNQLVNSGLAIRIQGGVASPPDRDTPYSLQNCSHCGQAVASRTSFTIQLPDGDQLTACCPHCGLLLLGQHPEAMAAMATDFLYLNKINVSQAAFLVDSSVVICCAPSVICFAGRADAESFRRGFGGVVLSYEDARDRIVAMMSLQHGFHE